MAILSRLVAVAALVSIAFAEIVGFSPAENYALAAQRARAHSYRRRDPHDNAASLQRAGEKRRRHCRTTTPETCSTTTSSMTASYHHSITTVLHDGNSPTTTTTTHTDDYPSTTSEKSTQTGNPSLKKGLAWSASNSELRNFLQYGNIKYIYNWGANPPQEYGLTAACMLWSRTQNLDAFKENAPNYPILMGPNEINLASQANMAAEDVVSLWNQYIRPYAGKKILVSPSVTSADSGPIELKKILDTCGDADGRPNCGFDYISLHYYGKTSQDLITYITKTYNALNNIPVWLSEFGCMDFANDATCTDEEVTTFMQEVSAWCESTEWIAMYSPYGFSDGGLGVVNNYMPLIEDGKPSSLAKLFLDA